MPSCSQGSRWCWPACSSPDFFSLKIGVAFAYFQPFLGNLIPLPSNFQAKRAWLLLFSQVSYLQFLPCDPYSSLSSLNIVKIDQIFMLLQGDTRQERHKRVELLAFFCTFLLFLLRKGVRILLVLLSALLQELDKWRRHLNKTWADHSLEAEVFHLPRNWLLSQQNHHYLWPLPK